MHKAKIMQNHIGHWMWHGDESAPKYDMMCECGLTVLNFMSFDSMIKSYQTHLNNHEDD